MTSPTKRIIIGTVGQSNCVGKRQPDGAGDTIADQSIGAPVISSYGAPVGDPLLPHGPRAVPASGYYGSMWPNVAERFALERNIWCSIQNTAVRGSGICNDWVGLVGGTIQTLGDGGYDPNGYIADMLSYIEVGAFDETWIVVMFGIADSGDAVTLAQFRDAHISLTDHMLTLGIKVALGLTAVSSSHGGYAWFGSSGVPGIAAAITNYSGNSNVIAGIDAHTVYGGDMTIPDERASVAHWSKSVYDNVSDLWFAALAAAVA